MTDQSPNTVFNASLFAQGEGDKTVGTMVDTSGGPAAGSSR